MRPIVTDRVAWSVGRSVGRSVTLVIPTKRLHHRDAVWVENSGGTKEPCIKWGPDPLMGRGNFEGEKGRLTVKYRDTLRSSVQKRLDRSMPFGL